MSAIDVAPSLSAAERRVRRLLRLGIPGDHSEVTREVLPFLNSIGAVALVGGAVRDVARAGVRAFSSDLDFVVYGASPDKLDLVMRQRGVAPNRFGGYSIPWFTTHVDVWHLSRTWAARAGHIRVAGLQDLLRCTFFDWDSVIYDLPSRRLIAVPGYLARLRARVIELVLEANPNPEGALVRAVRRAALWGVRFGSRLSDFCRTTLASASWDELCARDLEAFEVPVLKFVDAGQLLERLSIWHRVEGFGQVTMPVAEGWARQLSFDGGRLGRSVETAKARKPARSYADQLYLPYFDNGFGMN